MTSGVTRIEVQADRILVRPSFVDAITCSRLGGKWMPGLRAWLFPSGEHHAQRARDYHALRSQEEHHHEGDQAFAYAHAQGQQNPMQARAELVDAELKCGLLVSPRPREQPLGDFYLRLCDLGGRRQDRRLLGDRSRQRPTGPSGAWG